MPRLIDHEERDRDILAAAFAVLERDGLAGLSVRGVAAEAGIATASLRRAFPTQEALRSFCLAQIQDRAATRIRAVGGTGRARALGILCELLPLDAERRLELSAQLQLGVLALTDPSLHEASATLSAGVHTACTIAIDLLDAPAPEAAAGTLHIYLDGLALHALLDPEQHTPSSVRARLDDFLTELTRA